MSDFETNLKRVLLVCAVLLGGELFWLFVLNPSLPFSHIEVNAVVGLGRREILTLAGIDDKSSYLTVSAEAVKKSLEKESLIESVQVAKRFPDTLSIHVTGRRAIALAFAQSRGKTVPVFFDRNGVIFKIGGAGLVMEGFPGGEVPRTLPIVSGLVFENVSEGATLPVILLPFLASVERVAAHAPELLDAISEISINKKAYDGFDLIVYPVDNPVKIRLGQELNEDRLRYAFLQVDALAKERLDVDTVDCRTGTASYTLKG